MIPVTQTKFCICNAAGKMITCGNCWAAMIASILGLPINDVPNFEVFFQEDTEHPDFGFWLELTRKFLGYHNKVLLNGDQYRVFHKPPETITYEDNKLIKELLDDYYLISGDSPRGVLHVTIWKNGYMVHDPHPSRDGILNHKHFEVIKDIMP